MAQPLPPPSATYVVVASINNKQNGHTPVDSLLHWNAQIITKMYSVPQE